MLDSDVNDPKVAHAYERLLSFARKVASELAARGPQPDIGWLVWSFSREDELTYGGGQAPEFRDTMEEVRLMASGELVVRLVTVMRDQVISVRTKPLSNYRARDYDGREEWTTFNTKRGYLSVEQGYRKFHKPRKGTPPYLKLSSMLAKLRP